MVDYGVAAPPCVIDLRNRLKWGAYPSVELTSKRYIIIHHTAVDADSTTDSINNYHKTAFGWPGIGYQLHLRFDGRTYWVHDPEQMSYNVAGLNDQVVGVCLNGNFEAHWPTAEQLTSLATVVGWLHQIMPWAEVKGHSEIALPNSPTSCPGATWLQWKPLIEGSSLLMGRQLTEEERISADTIWGVSELLAKLQSPYAEQLKNAVIVLKEGILK